MTRIHALTAFDPPRLRLWRDRTASGSAELAYDAPFVGRDAQGLALFDAPLDHQLHEPAHALLHGEAWEAAEHAKTLPRTRGYRFPDALWCAQGAARMLARDPFARARDAVRIHLITARRYRGGRLFLWAPDTPGRFVDALPAPDADGWPCFDVALQGRERHLFLFKFVGAAGEYEPDYANRLWCAHDGGEIWAHSRSASISRRRPRLRPLTVRLLDGGAPAAAPLLHLWQEDSDFVADLDGRRQPDGAMHYALSLYSERPYRFLFRDDSLEPAWEHDEAQRTVMLREGRAWTWRGDGRPLPLGDDGVWTLAGDHHLFGRPPLAEAEVVVELADADPAAGLAPDQPLALDVWVNRARRPLQQGLAPLAPRRWSFRTYADIVTSFRFRAGAHAERLARHTLRIAPGETGVTRVHVVLGRAEPLSRPPVADLFLDPPFAIERPGAWIAGGELRFALHAPQAACAEVLGEWTDWERAPLAMRSTRDGSYWWAQVPLAEVAARLGRASVHGALYKFRLDQQRLVQDPAADWVESSSPQAASRLADHAAYAWRSDAWQRPGWEYLTVFQLHPARFARRGAAAGLDAVTRELTAADGYLHRLGTTALLLMPTCEFAGDMGWGYNPSFFYSVESAYGGPDALKRLVDACHERGIAVLLDVVFNHAGTSDNALWSVARESYFDGDTEWGAMINFDHPQAIHFFEQNLVHFLRHYRVDGFRVDFTRVIRFGHEWTSHVRQPGSGGGWEFLRRLRAAARGIDERCLLMAENLPNDWDLTRYGGVMDTQWCDDFHDRLVEAARGWDVMGPLAAALQLTHTYCDQWYEATNYPESHDEVGNEPNRIARVAGPGVGLRRNKVAAALTLLARGIPMWFMGAESGEWRQFSKDGDEPLDLDGYERDPAAGQLRRWWRRLCELRRGNPRLQGPAPLRVRYAQERMLAFSRGDGDDIFVIANFGDRSGWRPLAEFHLPDGEYKELLNSTWGDYRIDTEGENEHANGGWDARLHRGAWLDVPDFGVVVLERR
jgi:1,4-alpha-glucan branching enzyme